MMGGASEGASDITGGVRCRHDVPMMGGITYHCKTPLNIDIYPWWAVWWGGGGQGGVGLMGDNLMKNLKYEHQSIFPLLGRIKLNFRDR